MDSERNIQNNVKRIAIAGGRITALVLVLFFFQITHVEAGQVASSMCVANQVPCGTEDTCIQNETGNPLDPLQYFCDPKNKNPDGGTTSTFGSNSGVTTVTKDKTGQTQAVTTVDTSSHVLDDASKCISGVGQAVGCAANALIDTTLIGLGYFILTIANWLLFVSAALFNYAIIHTVFGFATLFGGNAGLLAAWGILRDIGNILLLFGFIFMGIATILNLHSYTAKKTLPALIIFTVLLNFSLFTAEAVIDTSNLLSTTFYKQAMGGPGCTGNNVSDCAKHGIATRILEMSGVSTEFSIGNLPKGVTGINDENAAGVIGLALFVTVAAVVLLAGAILLFIRAITLTFVMVLSPIGFAGMALPFLKGSAEDWWKRLLAQSFFAPVFLLFMFVSLKLTDAFGPLVNKQGTTLLGAAIGGNADALGIFVIFVLMIGFMVGSLMIAKQMGAYGADMATKFAGGMVGGATFGALGFVGRRTIGLGSGAIANNIAGSKWARSNPTKARLIVGAFDKGASSSFEFRNTAAGKAAASASGIELGKLNKDAAHGIHGIEEKTKKAEIAFAERLSQTDKEAAAEKAARDAKEKAQGARKILDTKWETDRASIAAEIAKAVAEKNQAKADKNAPAEKAAQAKESEARVKLADAQVKYRAEVKTNTEAIKDLDKTINENNINAVRREYAENINGGKNGHGVGLGYPSIQKHARHEAYEAIVKKLTRTDTDKITDALKDIKVGGGDNHSSGGGAPKTEKKTSGGGGGGDHPH